MRLIQSFFILISLFSPITACDQKPKNPASEYGDAMIDAYKKGQQAGVMANLDAVKKAVAAYHASNDRYPPSVADLKDLIGSDIDLAQYDYNPKNGTVSLKK